MDIQYINIWNRNVWIFSASKKSGYVILILYITAIYEDDSAITVVASRMQDLYQSIKQRENN